MKPLQKATVLGTGSWGTALASVVHQHCSSVMLWGRDSKTRDAINTRHENPRYLPNTRLSPSISATTQLQESLMQTELIISALPTQVLETVFSQAAPWIPAHVPVVSTSKGMCRLTARFPSHIIRHALKRGPEDKIFVLSGPSFALDTVLGHPTAVSFAGLDLEAAQKVGQFFFTPSFRTYPTTDRVGVELAGALKNCIAIAAGITDGLGLGPNTQAALITRGLAEMSRLGLTLGAQPLTFLGLAGVGDLILTCTGPQSRNRRLGVSLAQGKSREEALQDIAQTAEGVTTVESIHKMNPAVELPILHEVHSILFEGKAPRQAIMDLMTRPMRSEVGHERS